jgi:Mrp family chromosome partitioning ATPase/capsular polysaccharide biosynthesis protein
MDLLSYFRVLRRHWLMIAVAVVLGAGVGVATTLVNNGSSKSQPYYKATHTLFLDTSSVDGSDQAFSNVEQVAILATTGDVPNAVAKELGGSETGQQLAEHIVTLTNSTSNTVEITAVARSETEAVLLADTFSSNLIKSLDGRLQSRYNSQQATLNAQLSQLQAKSDALFAQLTAQPPPPNADTIKRQYDALQNQYYAVYGQVTALAAAGVPTGRLTSLSDAQSVPISKSEYDSRLSLGASGQNNLRAENLTNGDSAITVSSASGTTLNGKTSRGLLGAVLGLLVGVGLALISDRLDHRMRTRAEVEEAYGLPVLAEIPRFRRAQQKANDVAAHSAPMSKTAEAYRAVRTALLFQQASTSATSAGARGTIANGLENGNGAKRSAPGDLFEPEQREPLVIMVTSGSPQEGKTTTSANLAAVFAEAGNDVLIVNCDFRRPSIHRLLDVDDQPRTVLDSAIPGVKVVTNVIEDPNANPAQVVAAQRKVVSAARERFDVVILDTAPILSANDAVELVATADVVLLVARCELTTTDHAERTMEVLTRVEAPIAGVVLVASNAATSEYYYYYGQPGRPATGSRRRTSRQRHESTSALSTAFVTGDGPQGDPTQA